MAIAQTTAPERPPIVFVHGMFMTPNSWASWEAHFQSLGYATSAPAWPGRDGTPASLRSAPPAVLSELSLADVVDVYRAEIARLDRPPILVGHSMGGLVVQLLLQEQLAVAGVAISPAPSHGLSSSKWSFLRSNFPLLLPTRKPVLPSLNHFRYSWAHTLPRSEVAAIYEQYVVPESRVVGKGPTTKASAIDFRAPHPPLLLIAGEEDRIIPASLVRKTAKRYARGPSTAELRSFPGRTHWIVGQAGWEEVAHAVQSWLEGPSVQAH